MPLRFFCDLPNLQNNWVDVQEVWTRREVREVTQAEGGELLDLLHRKVMSCHIERVGGDPITDPAAITEEALDDVDLRLMDFLGTVLLQAGAHLRNLGKLSGRLQSDSAGRVADPTQA